MFNRILQGFAQMQAAKGNGNGDSAVPGLTDRTLRMMAEYVKDNSIRDADTEAAAMLVRGKGWEWFEAEISEEIGRLSQSAIRKMISPDPVQREEAILECIIIHVLNERVLGRVNRRVLNAALLDKYTESMKNMKAIHETATQEKGK